jgi:hypothetical protein
MKVTVDLKGFDAATRALVDRFSERRLNAAAATALTRTALDAKQNVLKDMRRTFDRPTPYTLNSLFVRPATASRVQSEVFFKDDSAGSGTPATKYLLPQVEGGSRRLKRFEVALKAAGHLPDGWFVVPGQGAKLDAYGNVSRGQIIQVLSQLRVTLTAGFTRNMSFEARKQIAAQRKAGGRFFVIRPGAKGAPPGVYQREFSGRNIAPVFIFVRSNTYRKRLAFYTIVQATVQSRLPVHLQQAIEEQAQRLAGAGR